MTVAILVEPMMMLSIFTAAISAGSINIIKIAETHSMLYTPSHILALSAFICSNCETGGIPVDNLDTHLELTMIHGGWSRNIQENTLHFMEWAHYETDAFIYHCRRYIFPLGISNNTEISGLALSSGVYF